MRLLASLLLPAVVLMSVNAAAATYQLIELATLAQATPVVVQGPNSTSVAVGGGRVVGTTGPRRGLVFRSGMAPQPITGLPGNDDTSIFGLNDSGGIVGGSNTATAVHAFISTLSGGFRELPPLPGDSASIAFGINNISQAVGFSSGPSGERAVIWAANGTPSALPGLPGTSSSRAMRINDRGDIGGTVQTAAGKRAVFWPGRQAGSLLALPPGLVTSEAYGINARSDVVGYSADAGGARHATLWPAGGAAIDLGALPGGAFSQAFGTNDAGDVVGTSSTPDGEHAFLWNRSTGLQDLNSLVAPTSFVLTKGVGINNLGVIVALGFDPADVPAGGNHDHESHELPVRVFLLVR